VITELAQIVKAEHDGLWVDTIRQSTCNSCRAKSGCGQRSMSSFGLDKSLLWVSYGNLDSQHFGIGDWVEIGIDERAVLWGSLLIYGLPLLLLIFGAGLGDGHEILAVAGALGGLLLGGVLARIALNRYFHGQYFQPTLIGRAPNLIDAQIIDP
jgi:sigma-E factor negative regulatory protein RseC